MRRIRKSVLSLVIVVLHGTAIADTHIYGPISESQTWTAEESPYIIHGEVWLEPSVELTVTEGVIVKLEPGVNASLAATENCTVSLLGTADAPILFTSAAEDPQPGDYQEIALAVCGVNFSAQHCIIEYARCGFFVNCPVAVVDVTIRRCLNGLCFAYVNGNIAGFNLVDNVAFGAVGEEWAEAMFRSCLIARNGSHGIFSFTEFSSVGVDNCVIQNNGATGILATGSVLNSIITSNSGHGVLAIGGITIEGNTIEDNSLSEIAILGVMQQESVTCTHNNLTDDDGLLFEVGDTCYTPEIDATGNYWGTTNAEEIASRIWDHNDNSSLPTVVHYIPFEGQVATSQITWGALKTLNR